MLSFKEAIIIYKSCKFKSFLCKTLNVNKCVINILSVHELYYVSVNYNRK